MKTPKITINYLKETMNSICDRCDNKEKCAWYEIIPAANLHTVEACDTFKEN